MPVNVTKSTRIGVLMGGFSSERDVSLETGGAILRALQAEGYNAMPIDVDRNLAATLKDEGIERAFLALHGAYGEDGTVQGLLEFMGIPYTGSGVMASAVAMDKVATKRLALYAGIPTPRFQVLEQAAWHSAGKPTTPPAEPPADPSVEIPGASSPLMPAPVVVKAPLEGSSIGITLVRQPEEYAKALELAFSLGNHALIEAYIPGREATVGILNGGALPLVEIGAKAAFYDYEAKYKSDDTEYQCPANFPEALDTAMTAHAMKLYRLLGCRGQCRVDFRISEDGEPFLLEINTIPGMTSHSLIPKAAAAVGISFNELVARILQGA